MFKERHSTKNRFGDKSKGSFATNQEVEKDVDDSVEISE